MTPLFGLEIDVLIHVLVVEGVLFLACASNGWCLVRETPILHSRVIFACQFHCDYYWCVRVVLLLAEERYSHSDSGFRTLYIRDSSPRKY